MRVLVLWEDERERQDAENLANVLVNLSPSLAAEAEAHADGTVSYNFTGRRSLPKVLVRAASWTSHFDQLMRGLLDA